MRNLLFVCVALWLSAVLPAQLLKNINTQPAPTSAYPAGSDPADMVAVGSRVYFSAATGATGRELYWADASGAPAQLLADIEVGAGDSNPRNLVALPGGLLVFTAQTFATGDEVWVSDGTAAGTQLLVDLEPGAASSHPTNLAVHQGHVYFIARQGAFSPSLWRTDGTAAGAELVEDLGLTGSYSPAWQMIASAGSRLFYTTSQIVGVGTGEWRLYVTDGSVGGSEQLVQVRASGASGPRELTAVGSRVAWIAVGVGTGTELWVSDGTTAGTGVVDLVPGPGNSGPSELTTVADKIFFAAYEGPSVSGEIFVTDGTVAGTAQVTFSTPAFQRPVFLAAIGNELAYSASSGLSGNELAYSASSGLSGNELWVTGATPGSERQYADFGPGGGNPIHMIPFAGGILCQATTPATGAELFFSDGTPSGTFNVADLQPGIGDSLPHDLIAVGGQVFFAATNVEFGHELWITDGTPLGTRLHTDLSPVPFDRGSYPSPFANLGDRVVFTADDGLTGKELWASDGTAAGTVQLTDFQGSGSSFTAGPTRILPFGGRAVFALDDGSRGTELWITDGTVAGTRMVFEAVPGARRSTVWPLIEWRGELYFAAGSEFGGWNLYATDGSGAGTRLLADFDALGGSVAVDAPVEHQGRLFFAGRTAATGLELWSTDGTAAGTALVADVNPGSGSALSWFSAASLGDHLYFAAADSGSNQEVWRTDGTAPGTELFADLEPTFGSAPSDLQTIGARVVFSARVNGDRQYYGADGAAVEPLSAAPLSVNSNWILYSNGQKLIGMLRGPNGSFELWGTDGTPAGSGVIKQIAPDGSAFVNLRAWRVSSGDKLLFGAGDAAVGHEIFITDGTAAGTGVLVDLVPGPNPSYPDYVTRLIDRLVFCAFERATGFELYELPLVLIEDWVAEPIGVGCPGSSGAAPAFDVQGSAQLGATLDVGLNGAAPSAPVAHLWSADYALGEIGGCTFYLRTPLSLAAGITSAQGSARLALPVPAIPALLGQGFWLQSLVVDAGGQFLGRASLTPALEIRVGG
ncbi:MAG: hypothetical protein AAF628_35395 [Planctomycetota bacterium]